MKEKSAEKPAFLLWEMVVEERVGLYSKFEETEAFNSAGYTV